MVYSTHFARDIKSGASSEVLVQDFPTDLDIEREIVTIVAEDDVASRGVLYRLRGRNARAAAHLMHPRVDQTQHYLIFPLLRAGLDVLTRASRWVNNDTSAVHETLLLDVAASMTFLYEERGYTDVVLVGNSGGGTLGAFYQEQAELAPPNRLSSTPAQEPPDLNRVRMPKASALVLIGAHLGQAAVLAKWIDPSVIDEADALSCNSRIDMYEPANGFREYPEPSKYGADFVQEYRAAQLARVARLDATARYLLDRQASGGRASVVGGLDSTVRQAALRESWAGWQMVVYRTAANPNFVDLSLDPDDRLPGSIYGGDPHRENYLADGLARRLTPRAWLSSWSVQSSRALTARCVGGVKVPTLIVHYAGDAGMTLAEVREIADASAAQDKQVVILPRIDHYGFPIIDGNRDRERSTAGSDAVQAWLGEHSFG